MADLTVTAGNVQHATGANLVQGIAGGTITAGMALYLASGLLLAAQNDDTAATAAAVGIATHGASEGQPLVYQRAGNINLGATLTVGKVYCVGAAGGGIAPFEDIVSTNGFCTVLGVATTASNLKMGIVVGGVAHA